MLKNPIRAIFGQKVPFLGLKTAVLVSFSPINSLVMQLEAFGGPKVSILGQEVPFLDEKVPILVSFTPLIP